VLSGNLSIFLPVNITNRVDSNSSNLTHDAILSVDFGSGFVPTGIAGQTSNQIVAFNGLSITVPSSGNLEIKISNIRAAVQQFGALQPPPFRPSSLSVRRLRFRSTNPNPWWHMPRPACSPPCTIAASPAPDRRCHQS
jgi:hypothetical protein